MPVGNINWSDETPAHAAKRKADKAKSDSLGTPSEVKMNKGGGLAVFKSLKAYNTRSNRTKYSS